MSLNTIVSMSQSQSLILRVAAQAAELGNTTPNSWASNNILPLVATAGSALQTAWDSAAADPNANPDTGKRDDVITDAMIQTAVSNMKAQQLGTQGWPAS